VYIAGPLSPSPGRSQWDNVRAAMQAAHVVMDAGAAPLCPHLFHFLDQEKARDYEEWMEVDLALLARCDVLWRLDGASAGADREVLAAVQDFWVPVIHSAAELPEALADARKNPKAARRG
jgi:hypothetical protein